MIKKILSTFLTLVLSFSMICCGDNKEELTTEQKKEIVEDLEQEIEDETTVKLNTKKVKEEDWNNFKNEFNSWKEYEDRFLDDYLQNTSETDLTIEEINSTMEQYKTNLKKYAPKELKDTIDELFNRNEAVTSAERMTVDTVYTFDYEGLNKKCSLVQELIDLIDKTIEKYDSEIS